ncbi:lysoplasmalogenase [Sphingomonas psychrotolerans]|uniref:Lysoplasmalogenase n=1 Tax=Sphingomonas psychrotolerans TaxID=1327635 RepID=A0ABU3N0G8_9SPHN|nr:lysoplasmalogenase family protein [Sphingomonas psychrotolerans]MDT8758040.1 lysoplasmalogenase [Sphingomonas psychrotolerans]
MASRLPFLFAAALAAGASYTANHWLDLDGPAAIAWKGSGVGLLALWAGLAVRTPDGRLIAAALALGALGDMLLNAIGLTVGAVAFLAGHLLACILYLRHRRLPLLLAAWLAGGVALLAYALPDDRAAAPGIALYALGLGAMFGTAVTSRFPRVTVGLGAALFVFSDLLIFAQMGPLARSPLPGLLIWPTYFAGQALIAWGVVRTLDKEAAA